jgi:hypothetical protein
MAILNSADQDLGHQPVTSDVGRLQQELRWVRHHLLLGEGYLQEPKSWDDLRRARGRALGEQQVVAKGLARPPGPKG